MDTVVTKEQQHIFGSGSSRPFAFVAWDGGCLFVGSAGGIVASHAHYALQIAFGSEPGIRFRTREQDPWVEYAGAIIPSRQPHSMDVTRVGMNVVLFVEPETPVGRAITERHLRHGIAAIPHDVVAEVAPPLFSAFADQRSRAGVERAARQVIHALSGGVEPSVVTDERILRVMAHIKSHVDQPIVLEDVADVACLSPSRCRHLFMEQTGVGLRAYVLWRRFMRVWELLSDGASLSTAAHAAGFADAAHLSRTSRSVFGFPPSAMQMAALLDSDGGSQEAVAS